MAKKKSKRARRTLGATYAIKNRETRAVTGVTLHTARDEKTGRRMGLNINTIKRMGGRTADPAISWAYRVRAAMNGARYKSADIIVYDASGKPIALIDPFTKERRPYVEGTDVAPGP